MPNEMLIDPAVEGQQPVDPSMAGEVPQEPAMGMPQEPDRTEEFRANLDELMNKIKEKYGQFSAMKFQSENKMQVMQEDTIKQLMELLQENGVDPSDENSINDFLETIKEQDEDLYLLMEKFIDIILNGIGNTPADSDISGGQVSELASKMGGEAPTHEAPVTGEAMSGGSSALPTETPPPMPPVQSGPSQFQSLGKPPTPPPMM